VPEVMPKQEVPRRGKGHGGAGVARVGLLHCVHGQDPDRVDGQAGHPGLGKDEGVGAGPDLGHGLGVGVWGQPTTRFRSRSGT
jgi:hypothetical protein